MIKQYIIILLANCFNHYVIANNVLCETLYVNQNKMYWICQDKCTPIVKMNKKTIML